MGLSNQKIEEKLAEYEQVLTVINTAGLSYKSRYIRAAIDELEDKFQRWNKKEIGDNKITALMKKIEDWINGFEFTDRIRELEMIINPFSPPTYQLISAPMGYGKTRLLEIAKLRLEHEQGWHCINLSLSRGYAYSIREFAVELLREFKVSENEMQKFTADLDMAQSCGERVGIAMVNFLDSVKQKLSTVKEKICIIIDQAELLDSQQEKKCSLIQEIFEMFLPGMSALIREKDRNIQWRFIFSGRYISDWENKINQNILPLKTYELELFEPAAIAETILNYAKEKQKKPTRREVQKIASVALYFTGGHPKCMVPIMKEGLNELLKDVIQNERKYYEANMLPVIADIKTHIAPLYETFEALSVVRKISRMLLDQFIRSELIKGYRSKFDIEESLLGTFIFRRKERFIEDAITRKVFAIHLRHSNATLFKEISLKAIECYLKELKDPQSLEPATLAVELLYLELQAYCINDYTKSDAKERFMQSVNNLIEVIERHRNKNALEIIESMRDILQKDQELGLNLQYLADAEMGPFLNIINDKINQLKA
jgi:hypothetical protein